MAPKTEATAPAKGPNLLLRKSLETQLAKCNKKALFHTNQANAYTAAAEDVLSYRPKPKSKAAKQRKRKADKNAKTSR
jgi:hypothetical protein